MRTPGRGFQPPIRYSPLCNSDNIDVEELLSWPFETRRRSARMPRQHRVTPPQPPASAFRRGGGRRPASDTTRCGERLDARVKPGHDDGSTGPSGQGRGQACRRRRGPGAQAQVKPRHGEPHPAIRLRPARHPPHKGEGWSMPIRKPRIPGRSRATEIRGGRRDNHIRH
jgi:hypothetical protein